MYTTSQIVERVKLQATDWTTLGQKGILAIINEVNREMMRGNTDHQVFIDSTTGLPPLLATTSGQFQYDMPANCRKIKDIMIPWDWNRAHFQPWDRYGNYQPVSFLGRSFYSVPGTARLGTATTAATFTFRQDPGNSTDRYYSAYWIEPTNIVSVNIQIDVHPDYHPMFIDGCFIRARALQYGSLDEWYNWLEKMKLEFWGDYNYNPPRSALTELRPA